MLIWQPGGETEREKEVEKGDEVAMGDEVFVQGCQTIHHQIFLVLYDACVAAFCESQHFSLRTSSYSCVPTSHTWRLPPTRQQRKRDAQGKWNMICCDKLAALKG